MPMQRLDLENVLQAVNHTDYLLTTLQTDASVFVLLTHLCMLIQTLTNVYINVEIVFTLLTIRPKHV